ncbi:MAG: hypothetical protein JSR70_10905 [Proteobacteria bacterium]|nr:hypothetical protein [Pseudomonadota bacterium]
MYRKISALLLVFGAHQAMAQTVPPVMAAEQVMHDFNSGGYVLGPSGNANFKYAQTFRLQQSGYVSHIMLPINCSNSAVGTITVRVTLQTTLRSGFPSGAVLATQDVPGIALNSWTSANGMQSMRMVEFSRPPLLGAGNYAFTVEAAGSSCVIWPGPAVDSYAGGQAFIINGVSLPSWYPWGRDLAFQVFERPL